MRTLTILLFLLAPLLAHAQMTYSPTPGAGYLPLDGATVSGAINIRMAGCPPGIWKFTVDGVAQPDETVCPIDMGGDNALYDTHQLSNGLHTITAGAPASTTTVWTAKFTAANSGTGPVTLNWQRPTQNIDGTALMDLKGYRVYEASNQLATVGDPTLTTYALNLPVGTHVLTMTAFKDTAESERSNSAIIIVGDVPVCGSTPPPENRSQTCPAPTIGSFSQSHSWTSVAAPACWQATPWTPDTAPAGVCALPALLTAGPYSYEVTGTAAAPSMSAIGLVVAGQPCGPVTKIVGTTKFCQVTRAQSDTVGWPVDRTLAKGVWAKAQ